VTCYALLGGAHIGWPLDRLPGLAPPCDVGPSRHGHPTDAERDAGQDIADEMDAEHHPRARCLRRVVRVVVDARHIGHAILVAIAITEQAGQ